MRNFLLSTFLGLALAMCGASAHAQPAASHAARLQAEIAPAKAALATDPWELGAFFQGGLGTNSQTDYHFLSAGARLGKVLTNPFLPGILRGQFEYAVELMPYWQAFTPPPHTAETEVTEDGHVIGALPEPYGGGTYTGFSINPIILRWNFSPTDRFAPWIQGSGGLVYTTHKFPPDVLVPHGQPGGTSVFNFTPQFGVGFHYFIKPRRSIDFAANAVHISSASLGDKNPGVNATVQFQIGYTWWQ